MKPFFDALLSASLPYDPHLIKRMAEALEKAARAEQDKLGKYDKSDALAGLIDSLSDRIAEIDAELEQPDPRISAGERMAAANREE